MTATIETAPATVTLAGMLADGSARWSGEVLKVLAGDGSVAGRLYRSDDGKRWRAWSAGDAHQCLPADRELIRGAAFADAVAAVLAPAEVKAGPVMLATADGEAMTAERDCHGSWACPFCSGAVVSPAGWEAGEDANAEHFAAQGKLYERTRYSSYMREAWEADRCGNPGCLANMSAGRLAEVRERQRRDAERQRIADDEKRRREDAAAAAEARETERHELLASVRGDGQQLGFAWACAQEIPAQSCGEQPTVCGASGYKRDGYVTHMRGHGARMLAPSSRPIRLRKKAPAASLPRLDFSPFKWLRWTETHAEPGTCPCGHSGDAHRSVWAREEHQGCTECDCDTEYVEPVRTTAERRGQFWSLGPRTRSVWVLPLEPAPWESGRPAPVLLTLPGKAQRGIEYAGTAAGYREKIRRADNVNAHGIYCVRDGGSELQSGRHGYYRAPTYVVHTDPECPGADQCEHQPASYGGYSASAVIRRLLSEGPEYGAPFCKRCVFLISSDGSEAAA